MDIISTYIINLYFRKDRKTCIEKEFVGREEFDIIIVRAIEHDIGSIGLWKSIRSIIKKAIDKNLEYILVCEDDHQFTENYSEEKLFDYIADAKGRKADILLGGISWFNNAIQINNNLFWVEKFSGMQFAIIFEKFFQTILNSDFSYFDAADYKISKLTQNKFFISPFISIQKDYGYSDVTMKNNMAGRVSDLFDRAKERVNCVKKVERYYREWPSMNLNIRAEDLNNIVIPTYIINLSERADRREHIIQQFKDRIEFDVEIVAATKHKIGAVGLWLSIRKIIEIAIANDDDVIIICEDDHEFTTYFNKFYLLRNIIEAGKQGVEILSGGISDFDMAIGVSENRYWINCIHSTQFLVLYKSIFQKILDEEYDETITVDDALSEITSNKMIIFPFISVQKDFGYSDINQRNGERRAKRLYSEASERLDLLRKARSHYLEI